MAYKPPTLSGLHIVRSWNFCSQFSHERDTEVGIITKDNREHRELPRARKHRDVIASIASIPEGVETAALGTDLAVGPPRYVNVGL